MNPAAQRPTANPRLNRTFPPPHNFANPSSTHRSLFFANPSPGIPTRIFANSTPTLLLDAPDSDLHAIARRRLALASGCWTDSDTRQGDCDLMKKLISQIGRLSKLVVFPLVAHLHPRSRSAVEPRNV